MDQISKEQAIRIYESGLWRDWSDEEKVKFQLYQSKLAMPFDVFCEAVESVFGRPVYTHEYAFPESLRAEFEGKQEAPTIEYIMQLLPSDIKVFVVA